MTENIDLRFMPDNTRQIFEVLSTTKFMSSFSLVGGTALALQIGHRISEDLDFIYDGDEMNINRLKRNIGKLYPEYRVIRQDHNEQLDIVIDETKITFFSSGAVALTFNIKEHTFQYKKLNICQAKVIASLKMAAIAQRNTIRDYYDLYWLSRYRFSLLEIIHQTKKLIPQLSPVTYTETLVFTNDIEEEDISEHLEPKELITKEQIAAFFSDELKKIIDQI
jgi:predicted nucleotidyltransferase component of viral defense system